MISEQKDRDGFDKVNKPPVLPTLVRPTLELHMLAGWPAQMIYQKEVPSKTVLLFKLWNHNEYFTKMQQ